MVTKSEDWKQKLKKETKALQELLKKWNDLVKKKKKAAEASNISIDNQAFSIFAPESVQQSGMASFPENERSEQWIFIQEWGQAH